MTLIRRNAIILIIGSVSFPFGIIWLVSNLQEEIGQAAYVASVFATFLSIPFLYVGMSVLMGNKNDKGKK